MDVSCLWIFMIFMDFWCLWILTVYLWMFYVFFNGTVYEAFEMWFAWSRLPWTALAPAETWSLNDRGKVWKSTFELKSIGIQKTSGSHHLNTWKSSFLIHIYIWLVVWSIWIIFPYIGNVIIPTDELIFFRGVGIPPTRIHLIDVDCVPLHFDV